MLNHQQALDLLRQHIKTENTIKHMLAAEAIMRALAKKFEPDQEEAWALAGLLHDIDYEKDLGPGHKEHGFQSVRILKEAGLDLPESVYQAIKAHCANLHPEFIPQNKMDWALFISDSLTGLIVATALVHPDRKLAAIKVESILKKFKNPSFARGTRREDIALCEEKLGLALPEMVELSLRAMQSISDDLGL